MCKKKKLHLIFTKFNLPKLVCIYLLLFIITSAFNLYVINGMYQQKKSHFKYWFFEDIVYFITRKILLCSSYYHDKKSDEKR